jgi:hypothetical protein
LNKFAKIGLLLFILPYILIYSQDRDSLLEQIKDIDISLNEPVESEENLYLNTVSFQSFYDILSPMGEWIQITKDEVETDLGDGEGQSFSSLYADETIFIWKPSTESGWKPYMNGKWEYSDHGWLWISKDKWGNSTYNYGRWWNSPKYGWVWMPGYTWAPAWVSWRVDNNGNHLGWVPLTPKAKWKSETGITNENYSYKNNDADWVFVNTNNFADELSSAKIVPAAENSALVQNSSRITNLKAEDDIISNNGPDVTKIEEKTGKKFNKKRLRFQKGRDNALIGINEIFIGKEKFNKRSEIKDHKGSVDRPKKYKKSEKVRKMNKKRIKQRRRAGT